MKILICNKPDCQDVFVLHEQTTRVCHCGLSSGTLVNGVTQYSGDHAVTMDIPMENMLGLVDFFKDQQAFKKTSTKEEDKEFCKKVIVYLNARAGTRYFTKFPSESSKLILQRQKETNCSLEDFYAVIDKKVQQWLNTEYQQYLNPETLFSKKHFSNYLGQLSNVKGNTTELSKFSDAVRAAKDSLS